MQTTSEITTTEKSENTAVFFDFGNTKIKWCLNTKDNKLLDTHSCFHHDIQQAIRWLQNNDPATIYIAASRQTPALDAIIQQATQQKIKINPIIINNNILTINYKNSAQFGIDRYLNLLAARTLLQGNFCVISAGTAITLDFYTDKHLGGVIFPGIHASLDTLQNKTGLNQIEKPNQLLGHDTQSSIGSGIYNGTLFAIEGFISNTSANYQTNFTTILTGGDAINLHKLTKNINQNLLFIGIQRYNTIDKNNRRD